MDIEKNVQPIEEIKQEESTTISLNLAGETKKKTKCKWPIIASIAVVAVAVITVLAIIFVPKIFSKTPATNTTIDNATQSVSGTNVTQQNGDNSLLAIENGFFANLKNAEPSATKIHINFDVDKKLSLLLKGFSALDALNDVEFDGSIEQNGGMFRVQGALQHDDASLPSAEILFDMVAARAYLSSSSLTDSYLVYDFDKLDNFEVYYLLVAMLADESVADDFLARYFALVVEKEQKQTKITASGISQECTDHVCTISAKEFVDLTNALITKFDNADAKYHDLLTELKNKINSIDTSKDIYYDYYTDNSGEIIGVNISYDNAQIFTSAQAINGKDMGLDIAFSDVNIRGNGKINDQKLDGKFIVFIGEENYLEIEPDDYDLDSHKKGLPNGTIEFVPSAKFVEALLGMDLGIKPKITVKFESNETERKISVSLMNMITAKIKITNYTPDEIVLPEGNEINGHETDALNKWLDTIDQEAINSELEKAGLTDIITLLTSFV